MSDADESGTWRAIQAARQHDRPWRLWGYGREADKLVLRSWGRSRSSWRSELDPLLVFHSPRYVRLESGVRGFELTTGGKAREVMQHPPPTCVSSEDGVVVYAHSDGGEFCVVCESVGYTTAAQDACAGIRWNKVPLAVNGENNLDRDRFYRPIDQSAYLGEIQGATLEWWGLKISHRPLILVATGLPGEPFALRFSYTEYVDCPTTMHNVRVRMATAEERETIRHRVSSRLAERFDRDIPERCNVAMTGKEALVAIECDEGVFSIWAGMLFLSWRDQGSSDLFDLRVP